MPSRFLSSIIGALAFAACALALHSAQADTQARAQVLTRNLKDGAQVLFLWDSHEKVPFTLRRQGNELVVQFEKPVKLRWGSSLDAVGAYIRQAEQKHGGDTVILTLKKPSSADYIYNVGREESDSEENGIELMAGKKAPPREQAPQETLDIPVTPGEGEAPTHAHVMPAHRKVKKLHIARAKPLAPSPVADTNTLARLAPAAGSTPAPTPAAPIMPPALPIAAAPVAPAIIPAPPITPVLQTTLSPVNNSVIALPFKEGEPFAVFILRNKLWIAADQFTPPSEESIRNAGAPFVKDVQTVSDPHATILTMTLEGNVAPTVEKTPSGDLELKLAPGPVKLAQSLTPTLATDGGKISLLIPAGKAAGIIAVRDPLTGTLLSIVPTTETAVGIDNPRSFVQFRVLPSSQGLAVQTLSDGISVNLEKGTVKVASDAGLAISPESVQQFRDRESEAALARIPPTLFPYAKWKLDDEKNLVPAQEKLFQDIALGAPDAANKARLKLLGLFLSEGMFPEALGMSDDILRSSLKFYRQNKVSALRGAAHLFMYHISEAQRDFSASELAGDKEAAMWSALADELLGEGDRKFDFPANYDRYISHYPPSFIQKLAVIAADRSISRKEYDTAAAIFETLKRDNYDEPVKKYIDYMRAKIDSETHVESEAVKIWEDQAKDLDDSLIRARAEFSLVNMLLADKKISIDAAIKRMERLRIVWRGDGLELGVLTLLGNLYLQEKQYTNALHTLREIVLYYPEVPEALTAARQMEQTFVTLYNKDGADAMPPLEALSLFYEFRDLVPLGAAGDQMIRNLADRLVSIDLLDRAAMLLEHQIKNRLQGEERSNVGARLAEVYLMNHQPGNALDTLKTTGYGDLPPALQIRRLRLTARALAQQGNTAKAIDVLSSDTSTEGTLLRLSIYWDTKDWTNVVSTAEDMLGNRSDPGAPLNRQESEILLKLATAYVYQHDAGQLQYLRDYFTPLMKNNPNRSSFLFITSESGAVDYDNLAGLEQDIGEVKSFLAQQEKPGKNGMSKAAN